MPTVKRHNQHKQPVRRTGSSPGYLGRRMSRSNLRRFKTDIWNAHLAALAPFRSEDGVIDLCTDGESREGRQGPGISWLLFADTSTRGLCGGEPGAAGCVRQDSTRLLFTWIPWCLLSLPQDGLSHRV